MPRLTTVSFQLVSGPVLTAGAKYPLTIGCFDEIQGKTLNFPQGEYGLYAPYIGVAERPLGDSTHIPDLRIKLTRAIELCMTLAGVDGSLSISKRKEHEEELKVSLREYQISQSIIRQYYFNFLNLKAPIEKHRPIFTFLMANGARWRHLLNLDDVNFQNLYKPMILALGKDIFGTEALSDTLAATTPWGPNPGTSRPGFEHYKRAAEFYLELGVDLNGKRFDSPEHGTFLHQCLAYEAVFVKELMDFLASKRNTARPHTCFNFAAQDGDGKTPLMIAIATRNIEAAFRLLELCDKQKIDIGLDLKDKKGRTPLMLAAAFGLPSIVEALLKNNANPHLTDPNARKFTDYLALPDPELKDVLSLMVHPERGDTGHSYLIANDAGKSPYCLYEDGESSAEGDAQIKHFIVLSPLPQHQARLQKVVDILKAQVKRLKSKGGLEWEAAQASLEFVTNQISVLGRKTFMAESKEGQIVVKAYLSSANGMKMLQTAEVNHATGSNGGLSIKRFSLDE
jgi:ankyrin repeat protein